MLLPASIVALGVMDEDVEGLVRGRCVRETDCRMIGDEDEDA